MAVVKRECSLLVTVTALCIGVHIVFAVFHPHKADDKAFGGKLMSQGEVAKNIKIKSSHPK